MQIDVVVREDRAVGLLDRLTRRLDDGRPQLLRLVDQLLDAERLRFAGGIRWKRAQRDVGIPGPMIKSGRLLRSLTVRGNPDQRLVVRQQYLTFGTRVYYARFHQRGQGGMPKRVVVGLTRIQRQGVAHEYRRLLLEDL